MLRHLHFARHVPPTQILRRASLELRRRVERRVRPGLDGTASLAPSAPGPVFPPGQSATRRTAGGWRLQFLGLSVDAPAIVDLTIPGSAARDQLWTMSLHYFEHAEALDDDAWGNLADQWIAANPPYAPGSTRTGWNAYALSLRVVSWLQQLALRRDRLPPDLVARVASSAAAQLHYLERHLETDIGGNHLFKNILALLWGSAALESARAARWRRLGLRLLDRELAQFLPDGMHYERSPSYHAQVIGDCLSIRHALAGDPLGGRLDQAIRKGLQVLADLAHPDGLASLFGDAGLHMARPPEQFGALPAPRSSFAYPDAGYFGLRGDGGDLLIVDAGPLGPDSLPGHAHGDMFAFEWSVAGQRVIVDQGVFEYVGGERRQAARSAANHNTVAAPGADQGEFYSAFRLGRRARLAARTVDFDNGRMRLTASHSGFVGHSGGVGHERQIDATSRTVRIRDRLTRPLAGASASLLLAPQARPSLRADGSVDIAGFDLPIRLTSDCEVQIDPAVWWPDMGVEIPTSRLRISLGGSEGAFELRADQD